MPGSNPLLVGLQVLLDRFDILGLMSAIVAVALLLRLAFLFVLVGYGTKIGLAPFHTWLPDAHSQAPSPISALLSGAALAVSKALTCSAVSFQKSAIAARALAAAISLVDSSFDSGEGLAARAGTSWSSATFARAGGLRQTEAVGVAPCSSRTTASAASPA